MKNFLLHLAAVLISMICEAGFYNDFALYTDLLIFPHQIAIADVICTGTAVTNCNGEVALFSVDECLWGALPSLDIRIRCADDQDRVIMKSEQRYLVFAFTNNWWSEGSRLGESFCDTSVQYLSEFLSPTSRPPDNAVFSECRIMNSRRSVFNFNMFESGGTNYWQGTRTFITNFLEISRIQQSETNAFLKIDSILGSKPESERLPPWILRQLLHYNWVRYNNNDHLRRVMQE